nr:type VI secretion system protein TssA [uncultured Desulfobacter sp.]
MDMEAMLRPIEGDNPSGEDLRYTAVYDDIQEARRADEVLEQGDWQHELKTSDWATVYSIAQDALTTRTKDIQIAAWLLEALTATRGFEGVALGLEMLSRLLEQFWDTIYPEIDDGDLDYRIGPLEFINDKLWFPVKEIAVTDPASTPGYTWNHWQESRHVGYEKDTVDQYGDEIENKKAARDEQIAEGKLTAEEFDSAVAASSKQFYEILASHTSQCMDFFNRMDAVIDEKFGNEAPRLAEIKSSLEACNQLVGQFLKTKKGDEPDEPQKAASQETEPSPADEPMIENETGSEPVAAAAPAASQTQRIASGQVGAFRVNRFLGGAGIEEAVWQDALLKLGKDGIKPALEQLLGASCSAQSVREKTNFKLLMARLCLKGNRPDLARPIVEELNTLIEDLALDRWESPIWIAEALGTLYQCLTAEGSSDDDHYRARDILTRLCTLDVTKAMEYSNP